MKAQDQGTGTYRYFSEDYRYYVSGGSSPGYNMCNKKGTLFDLLPTDILNIIDIWIFGLEYSINLKAAAKRINGLHNTILHMDTYQNRLLAIYYMTRYEWAYRRYKNSKCDWRPNTHLVKHKHELMN